VRREQAGGVASLDLLADVFNWILRVGGFLLVAITGYYIYWAWATGSATQHTMAPAEFARHSQNLDLFTKILLVATVATAAAALGRFYSNPETGGAFLLVGLLFFWGMPAVIRNFSAAATDKRLHSLTDYLEGRFQLSGLILLVIGGIFLIFHGLAFVAAWKSRRPQANSEAQKTAQQVRKKQDKFLGPCWELPFCRDTEKKLCPIRKDKKSCWRTGRGCYCDQNVILTLSGGNQYQASRGATGYLSRTATVSRPKSLKEKREQCLQCPVYLHRQSQKYWFIAPGSIILLIAALILKWDAVTAFYPTAILALGRAMGGLSVGPSNGGVPAWATDMAGQTYLAWVVVVVVVMLALAYILNTVEWLLYRLGI
jgi:hypothetical protein